MIAIIKKILRLVKLLVIKAFRVIKLLIRKIIWLVKYSKAKQLNMQKLVWIFVKKTINQVQLISINSLYKYKVSLLKLERIDLTLLCNAFPNHKVKKYGGEFIRSRVDEYAKALENIIVIEINECNKLTPSIEKAGNVIILRVSQSNFVSLKGYNAIWRNNVFIHSPTPWVEKSIIDSGILKGTISIFYHGYEIRDYRRLIYNYTRETLANDYEYLERIHKARVNACQKIMSNPSITTVFVSKYLREICLQDMKIENPLHSNIKIIPNFIDVEYFKSQRKLENDRYKLLMIKSFQRVNYAGDIACEALLHIKKYYSEIFDKLEVTIYGTGRLFDETVADLITSPNISIKNCYLSKEEMRAAFREHGVLLSPSRFDTQGVTMCEAMAAGLPIITNEICAIPEFMKENSGVLCKKNDPYDFAKGILELISDPSVYVKKSENASREISKICNVRNTCEKELSLLKSNLNICD